MRRRRDEVLLEARRLFVCPHARGLVDERAALEDDRGLIGEKPDEIEIVFAEHRFVIRVRLERSEALLGGRDRRDQQRAHAVCEVGGSQCRMRAPRIRVVLRVLGLEHPPREIFALAHFGRQAPVRIVKAKRVRLAIEEADRRSRAKRRACPVLQRADDRCRVRHARQAGRAAQERAELRLLPGAPEDLRWGEPDEIGDRGREGESLSQSVGEAGHRGRQ